MNFRLSPVRACVIAALFCLSIQLLGQAAAQQFEFTGGGDGFRWNDGDNWSGGVVPGQSPNGDPVLIESQTDVQVNSPTTVGGIFFQANDSTFSINAATTFDNPVGTTFSFSTINVNADTNAGSVELGASTFNLNSGTFDSVGGIGVGNGDTLNLNGGVLNGSLSLDDEDPDGGVFGPGLSLIHI